MDFWGVGNRKKIHHFITPKKKSQQCRNAPGCVQNPECLRVVEFLYHQFREMLWGVLKMGDPKNGVCKKKMMTNHQNCLYLVTSEMSIWSIWFLQKSMKIIVEYFEYFLTNRLDRTVSTPSHVFCAVPSCPQPFSDQRKSLETENFRSRQKWEKNRIWIWGKYGENLGNIWGNVNPK